MCMNKNVLVLRLPRGRNTSHSGQIGTFEYNGGSHWSFKTRQLYGVFAGFGPNANHRRLQNISWDSRWIPWNFTILLVRSFIVSLHVSVSFPILFIASFDTTHVDWMQKGNGSASFGAVPFSSSCRCYYRMLAIWTLLFMFFFVATNPPPLTLSPFMPKFLVSFSALFAFLLVFAYVLPMTHGHGPINTVEQPWVKGSRASFSNLSWSGIPDLRTQAHTRARHVHEFVARQKRRCWTDFPGGSRSKLKISDDV